MDKEEKIVKDFKGLHELVGGSDAVVKRSKITEDIADAVIESARRVAKEADFEEGEAEINFLRPKSQEDELDKILKQGDEFLETVKSKEEEKQGQEDGQVKKFEGGEKDIETAEKAEWGAKMKKIISQVKKEEKRGDKKDKEKIKKLKQQLRETKEQEPGQNVKIEKPLSKLETPNLIINDLTNKSMPKEDSATTSGKTEIPSSEELAPKIPKETPRAESRQQEELGRTFIPDTRSRFERLKDWAKEKVVSLYEKVGAHYLAESPVVGAMATEKGGGIFNRIEAAFNNKLMKWHEDKAIGIAQKLDSAKNWFAGFENGRKMLEQSLADLDKTRQQGISTVAVEASIKREMRKFDEKMTEAQAEVNKYQSKLESRNNKMAGYVNARDRACESLVNRYDEKLRPWEAQAESIKKYSEDLNAEIERVNFKRDQTKKQINDFSQKYQRFMSRRDMKAALSGLTMQMEDWNKQIDAIAKEKSVMDGRLSRAEDRANVYRDKKSKIAGYTKGRPVMPETGERTRAESYGEKEEIKTEGKEDITTESEKEEEPQGDFAIQDWLKKWNEHLKEKNVPEGDLINESVWQNWIGRTDSPVDFKKFKKSLDQYYGMKSLNMPRKNFADNIDGFAEKRRKEEIENQS